MQNIILKMASGTHDVWFYLSTSVPLVLSMAALAIAWRQYAISKEKLRLDLFDKRFSVYASASNLFQLLQQLHGEVSAYKQPRREEVNELLARRFCELNEAMMKFKYAISSTVFLFEDDDGIFTVYKELDKVFGKTISLVLKVEDNDHSSTSKSEREKSKSKWDESCEELDRGINMLRSAMHGYLYFPQKNSSLLEKLALWLRQ